MSSPYLIAHYYGLCGVVECSSSTATAAVSVLGAVSLLLHPDLVHHGTCGDGGNQLGNNQELTSLILLAASQLQNPECLSSMAVCVCHRLYVCLLF